MEQSYNNFWIKCFLIVLFGLLVSECTSYVLIEGDMMVESTVGSVQSSQIEKVRSKRAIMNKKKIWNFGVVPYEIDTTVGFGFSQIAKIKAAMKHWEHFTCIIFVERNPIEHEDFIRFTHILECGCCSDIGKIGERQDVGVSNCVGVGGIIHEIGHIIGFHHEHQRPDRDEYVEVKRENLSEINDNPFFESSFKKLSPDVFDTLGKPYDHQSIMHYDQMAGAKSPGLSTIVPKKGKNGIVPKMGRHKRLSAIDIRKANKLYKCPECGQTYLERKAAFTSPQYYSKSIDRTYQCEWRIKAIKGERILLKISDLDTFFFDSSDCRDDYLEVYDGYWHNSPLLARVCGTEFPKHIASTGNHMFIKYISSDTEHEHRGFAANYETFYD